MKQHTHSREPQLEPRSVQTRFRAIATSVSPSGFASLEVQQPAEPLHIIGWPAEKRAHWSRPAFGPQGSFLVLPISFRRAGSSRRPRPGSGGRAPPRALGKAPLLASPRSTASDRSPPARAPPRHLSRRRSRCNLRAAGSLRSRFAFVSRRKPSRCHGRGLRRIIHPVVVGHHALAVAIAHVQRRVRERILHPRIAQRRPQRTDGHFAGFVAPAQSGDEFVRLVT